MFRAAASFYFLVFACLGCANSMTMPDDLGRDGAPDASEPDGSGVDLGGPDEGGHFDAGDGSATDAADLGDGATMDSGPPVPCGAASCAPGEACCFGTGACFDPGHPSACPPPDHAADPLSCTSILDCPAGWGCLPTGGTCVGAGRCLEVPDHCAPTDIGCTCDGREMDFCDALRAGIAMPAQEAQGCGHPDPETGSGHWPIIVCGRDDQCPFGSSCCRDTGHCTPSDCPDCCALPPASLAPVPGIWVACRTNAHCPYTDYCEGSPGTCGELGYCIPPPDMSSCTGALHVVCGCDGNSYTNDCTAHAAGVRIDHEGAC